MKTGNKIRSNCKRRHWRRTKLNRFRTPGGGEASRSLRDTKAPATRWLQLGRGRQDDGAGSGR
uniref:Ribosomal protein L39-like n=1 Tax=Pan troglodytes TaxID=9598 RepID=K7CRR1_PANTR